MQRGVALFRRDGTFGPGIAAGLLFAAEFVFIYGGLAHTNAARMSVFIYLTFMGLFLAFAEGLFSGQGRRAVGRQSRPSRWASAACSAGSSS
jgi:hypothetical protein